MQPITSYTKRMKRLTTLYALCFLGFLGSTVLSSCSNDTPTKEEEETTPSEKPEGVPGEDETPKDPEKDPEASDELLKKLQAIYDHASIDPQQVTTVNQLAILTSYCASQEVAGPITVTPASLNGEEITLVTLGGTEEKEGQATTLKESQLASFGKPNDYLTAVTKLFADQVIPKEKPVLVTGISLGGMIAQQLLGDSLVTTDFTLCGIITFGSPINLPLDRKGVKVVRFADVNDKVPQMGEMLLRTGMVTPHLTKEELKNTLNQLDEQEKIVRTSQYTELIQTHALSYIDEPCWDDVDFLGSRDRKNVLVLHETMKFYPAPQLSDN